MNLKPVARIDPENNAAAAWLRGAAARAVMSALHEDALFVGGCVRNALLGASVKDVDLATPKTPEAVIADLKAAGLSYAPTGIDHGTVTAIVKTPDGAYQTFEITTLRRDLRTDGRHAVVDFTQDWAEDARRRDFTMNTLLADGKGNVFDPTGEGYADLQAGRVRFVGPPRARIREDYLRILRFFRFSARYGSGGLDPDGLAACAEERAGLDTLSRERIMQEVFRLLGEVSSVDKTVDILWTLNEYNFLSPIFSDPEGIHWYKNLIKNGRIHSGDITRLIACANKLSLADMEKYLLFSNAQKRAFLDIVKCMRDPFTQKTAIYHYGYPVVGQALALAAARPDAPDLSIDVDDYLALKDWRPPVFPVTGHDVKDLRPDLSGPEIGAALREAENWWLAQDFLPDRDACLAYLAGERLNQVFDPHHHWTGSNS